MPIIASPEEFHVSDLFVDLTELFGARLLVKCEGFNFAGSIKLKPALRMVSAAERSGRLTSGGRIIESSSGNLGVALAMIAAARGYSFTCVTDTHCNSGVIAAIRALGASIKVVETPDPADGFLGARLQCVAECLSADPGLVWVNQYENAENWQAHYDLTAREIAEGVPEVSTLFVGAGTSGTLTGCAAYMRRHRPDVAVIGVDSVGSVNFGGPVGSRVFPGIGAAMPMPLLRLSMLADTVYVPEQATAAMSRELAGLGYLFGASTCTVLAGVKMWLAHNDTPPGASVAVSADMGGQYYTTLYDDDWVSGNLSGWGEEP